MQCLRQKVEKYSCHSLAQAREKRYQALPCFEFHGDGLDKAIQSYKHIGQSELNQWVWWMEKNSVQNSGCGGLKLNGVVEWPNPVSLTAHLGIFILM